MQGLNKTVINEKPAVKVTDAETPPLDSTNEHRVYWQRQFKRTEEAISKFYRDNGWERKDLKDPENAKRAAYRPMEPTAVSSSDRRSKEFDESRNKETLHIKETVGRFCTANDCY